MKNLGTVTPSAIATSVVLHFKILQDNILAHEIQVFQKHTTTKQRNKWTKPNKHILSQENVNILQNFSVTAFPL